MPRELPYKDYEGAMVKSQLMKIENYAKKLNEMIKDNDEIESWVQAKLTKVDAYMGDVKHYLDYAYDKKFADGGMMKDGGKIDSVEITFDDDDGYKQHPSVDIEIKSGDNTYEVYGNIDSYNTGRAEEYEFEPSWFSDDESEKFYSENWEDIEELVIDAYYKELSKKHKRRRI